MLDEKIALQVLRRQPGFATATIVADEPFCRHPAAGARAVAIVSVALLTALLPDQSASLRAQVPSPTLRGGAPRSVGIDPDRLEHALALIERAVNAGQITGGVVLVARRGVIVAERAYGLVDAGGSQPFRPDTISGVASLSKPIATVAAMTLVDEGRLGLDDDVERYLPAFKDQMLRMPDGREVHRSFTVRHLLTHTSGLRTDSPLRDTLSLDDWLATSLEETVDAVGRMPLEYEPGTDARYSNIGIATLGRVIEVVSGQAFEAFVTARVFEPLGMRDSYYNVPAGKAARTAPFYHFDVGGTMKVMRRWRPDVRVVNTMPNAGVFSTARDLAVFLQMLLNGGAYNGRRVLQPRTARLMIADHTPHLPQRWGLGWTLGTGRRDRPQVFSERAFSHTGGGRHLMWGDHDEQLVGVALLQPPLEWSAAVSDVWSRLRTLVYAALES